MICHGSSLLGKDGNSNQVCQAARRCLQWNFRMRIMVTLFFPLLGVFDYFRMQQMQALGYLIFMFPFCISIAYVLVIKPVLSLQLSGQRRLFNRMSGDEIFHVILMVAYVLIVVTGFLRAAYAGTREINVGVAETTVFLALVFFFYAVILDAIRRGNFDSLLNYIGMSLFLLILANVLGMAVGISAPGIEDNYSREFSNPLSFTGYRVIFPFMTSGQMLSIQAGALVIFGIFRNPFSGNKSNIFFRSSMIAVGMIVLIGHGGRAAMALLLMTLIFVAFWKLSRPFLPIILTIFLLFPALVILGDIGGGIQGVLSNMGVQFSRHEGDVASFSNRDKIFATIVQGYVTQGGGGARMIGYGAYGQVTSGLSYDYAELFKHSYAEPFLMSTHNTVLQVLVDYGYFGVGVFALLVINLAVLVRNNALYRKRRRQNNKNERLMVALLLYTLGSAMTESSISYYSFGVWSIFIALNMLILFDRASVQFKTDVSAYCAKMA